MKPVIVAMLADILPIILQLVGLALAAWLARVSTFAKARWGIEIEARHREALHSALMTGIKAAVQRGLTGHAAMDAAISYAGKSVPDAIEALGPSGEVLVSLAESKLREAFPALLQAEDSLGPGRGAP